MAVFPAPFLTRLSAPSSSSSSSESESYDYSGLDDHIKRQDAIGALRDNKFASLYAGDVAGSVTAGGKIRNLLAAVRANAPDATERDPNKIASPLVRITSRSTNTSNQAGGGGVEFDHGPRPQQMQVPQAQEPPPQGPEQRNPPPAFAPPKEKPIAPGAGRPLNTDVNLPGLIRQGGVNAMRLDEYDPDQPKKAPQVLGKPRDFTHYA